MIGAVWQGELVRTLIIGAGIAGLTLAGRLCQQGRPPVIVERAASSEAGYTIGLYPLGSCVLHGLGTYGQLAEQAVTVGRYELAGGSGRVLQALDMSVLTGAVGPMLMIGRSGLLRLLETSCTTADLHRGVAVSSISQHASAVEVTFDDGTAGRFDAVVGCDGVASSARELVFGPAAGVDTGWALWTWWANAGEFGPDMVREWWGTGCFFGVYPAPDRVMCAAGGPAGALRGDDARSALQRLLAGLAGNVPAVGAAIGELRRAYLWPIRDVRSRRWVDRRVALCGDSAASFMPTAGIGASCAMRAAAGLADEMSRADAGSVPLAFELYQKRCRSVVERNQADSRRLARVMLVRRPLLARARDQLARRYPAERMLRQIIDSTHQPF